MSNDGMYGSKTGQNMLRVMLAECFGTFVLVGVGTLVAVNAALARPIAGAPADSLAVALAFGLTLTALIYMLGNSSGCHLNPGVTLGLTVAGKFPVKFLPGYVVSQFAGAFGASFVVAKLAGKEGITVAALGATQPAPGVSTATLFMTELVASVIFFMVIFSIGDNRTSPSTACIAGGFALTVVILAIGPYTGGGVNPARAIAPMILSGNLTGLLAYLSAPLLAGPLAALIYDGLFASAKDPAE